MRTGYSAFDREYTYDHNGNRLAQTQNGALTQSFTYDAHDKLTGGIGETESYDPNGNLTAQTLNGQTTRFTWDDEDRLASTTLPDGHTDGNTYTGLGLRLSKTDRGVGYAYLCAEANPACINLLRPALDSPARTDHNTLRQLCKVDGSAGLRPGGGHKP